MSDDPAGDPTSQQATASGHGRTNQVGRDQYNIINNIELKPDGKGDGVVRQPPLPTPRWRRTLQWTAAHRAAAVGAVTGTLALLGATSFVVWEYFEEPDSRVGVCLAKTAPLRGTPEVQNIVASAAEGIEAVECPYRILSPITTETAGGTSVYEYEVQAGASVFSADVTIESPFAAVGVEFRLETEKDTETVSVRMNSTGKISIPVTQGQTLRLVTTVRTADDSAVGYAAWDNAYFRRG